MSSTPRIVDEAEGLVRRLAAELARPQPRECLCCYVARSLDEAPCNGTHRHSLYYRDVMAPRATALTDRLAGLGACCCDCELFLNGYELDPELEQRFLDGLPDDVDPAGVPLPPCAGVRRGSVRPCANWVRVRRR